ncbi:hypothetical protein VP01_841g2 [Puccinia sorghi]|uniref:Uncharacterized protein n=1 Tax=Puccinia sorghi TaxID=27349 RepID=A0A0L6U9H6_9BASI|nr:hypothetical protein VP01_841g2 [Puccinia sorghi]
MLITKYLIANEHIRDQQDVTHIFFQGFPKDMQRAIKHEMVKSDLIPYGKDGYPKTPHLEDLMDVAEDEVRAAADETFIGTGFGEANRFMQKKLDERKGDGKKREKMIEENPPEALQKQVETLSKAIESLTGKVENQSKGEYSRGNDRPIGKLYDPRPCHYCHREGHSAGYFNAIYQNNNPLVFETKEELPTQGNITSSVHKIDWEPPCLGSTNFEKIQMEANATTTRAEALRGRRKQPVETQGTPMDIDVEDPSEEHLRRIFKTSQRNQLNQP